MNPGSSLGEQELEILNFVADNAPVTSGEVAKHFATSRNLARTTILTVLERLRAKNVLTRKQIEGVFHYSPQVDHQNLLTDLVAKFVERSLGGSLDPFVAYLANSGKLSDQQIRELEAMIAKFEAESTREAS